MTVVILCGGAGTRLWPLSRRSQPKQFCDLFGDGRSLFQRAILRNAPLADKFMVVTNKDYYPMAKEQFEKAMQGKNKDIKYILEPEGRNTAPAIAMAALESEADETLVVVPSDHLIRDEKTYRDSVGKAAKAAADGYLCTFGLDPEYAETGYGYIEVGEQLGGGSYSRIAAFKEKPDAETATRYIAAGNYAWNSGMFVFKARYYLEELGTYAPEIAEAARKADMISRELEGNAGERFLLDSSAMHAVPSQSIDYAVMEKSEKTAVVTCSIGWTDLGSWDAVFDVRDGEQKNIEAEGCLSIDSERNLVVPGNRKIVLVGMSDCIVVDTKDALLVLRRGTGQQVKRVVDGLQKGSISDKALL